MRNNKHTPKHQAASKKKGRSSLSRKTSALLLTALLSMGLIITGSFAWFDFSQTHQNRFVTTSYNVELVDVFTEEKNWSRDENINKDVSVRNISAGGLLVRLSLSEHADVGGTNLFPDALYTGGADYAAATGNFRQWTKWLRDNTTDPVMDMADYTALTAQEKRAYTGWILDTDGWFYWSQILEGGEETTKVLDSVTLLQEADGALHYYIDVSLQAISADLTDLAKWNQGEVRDNAGAQILDLNGEPMVNAADPTPEAFAFITRSSGVATLPLTAEDVPDNALRSYLTRALDEDGNGVLTPVEISNAQIIDLSGVTYASLTGLERLTNVQELNLGANASVTALDAAPWKQLRKLDVTGCAALKTLNISQNTKLTELFIEGTDPDLQITR